MGLDWVGRTRVALKPRNANCAASLSNFSNPIGDMLLDQPSVLTGMPKTLFGRGWGSVPVSGFQLGALDIPRERERGFASQLARVPASKAGTQLLEVA